MNKIYLLLISIIGLTSCINKESSFPKLNIEHAINTPRQFSLNDKIESIKYIVLETNKECILGDIVKIIKCENKLFISDKCEKLYIFDLNGKYIRTVGKKGRGPFEYLSLTDFVINSSESTILINSLGSLITYDFNGNFIKKTSIANTSLQVLSIDMNNRLYYIMPSLPPSTDSSGDLVYVYDSKGVLLKKIKSTIKRRNGDIPYFNSIYTKNNYTYYKEEFNDKIYRINSKLEKDSICILNFGDYAFNQDDFSFSKMQKWSNKYRLYNMMIFKDLVVFNIQKGLLGKEIYTLLWDIKKQELINPCIDNNSKEPGLYIDRLKHKPIGDSKNELICLVSMEDVIENIENIPMEIKKYGNSINEESNPIISILAIR